MGAHEVGLIFFGWGLLLAFTSVVRGARACSAGSAPSPASSEPSLGFAVILAAMAVGTEHKPVLVVGVILAGAFLGINNTLITETVMKVSPVERGVASAAYSFVRFGGGAVAPWLAGTLGERSIHLPFWVGSGAVVLGVLVLLTASEHLPLPRRGGEPRRRAGRLQDRGRGPHRR